MPMMIKMMIKMMTMMMRLSGLEAWFKVMDLRCWWKFVANSFSKFRILSWVMAPGVLGFFKQQIVGYPQCDEPVVVASPLHRNVCCLPC